MDLSYYKINKLLWRWSKEDGARIVLNVSLSLDRVPPAREEPKSTARNHPKKAEATATGGGWLAGDYEVAFALQNLAGDA